jgi:hypothetical protein
MKCFLLQNLYLRSFTQILFFVAFSVFCNPVASWGQVIDRNLDRDFSHLTDEDFFPITNNATKGVTVITHGFQAPRFEDISFLDAYAIAIQKRAGGKASVYINDLATGNWIPSGANNSGKPEDEIILLYNWSVNSNNPRKGYLEAAADQLFAMLLNPPSELNITRSAFLNKPKHFLGHSRGTLLLSEVFHRFQENFGTNVKIEHFTSLDPHPAVGTIVTGRFRDEELSGVSADNPSLPNRNIYKLTLSPNVIRADNYYQMYGNYELPNLNLPHPDMFDGVYVQGAYNTRIQTDKFIDDNCVGGLGGDHSKIHAWYYHTILNRVSHNAYTNCLNPNFSQWYREGILSPVTDFTDYINLVEECA